MAENRKIVRVFLASPGDLKEERAAAKQVVDELNQNWLAFHGYHVELVGWEITVSSLGRPQALINQDLDLCEFFIGAVWKRWGTPPSATGPYKSGFEEEFRRSLERHKTTGKPEMSLFFKAIDDLDRQDPGPQLSTVLSFKKEVSERREIYYQDFTNSAEFQSYVNRAITRYVQRLIVDQNEAGAQEQSSANSKESKLQILQQDHRPYRGPFSKEGVDFLQSFLSRTSVSEEESPPTPVEVARFRLLGNLITAERVDEPSLGAHDANLLFEFRDDLDLGPGEVSALTNAGLAAYQSENIPLWHWIGAEEDDSDLSFKTFGAPTEAMRTGALVAMRDLGEPLVTGDNLTRDLFVRVWLGAEVPSARKVAALKYLAEMGVDEDLELIESEISLKDYQTASAAAEAIIRIKLRNSRVSAFEALLELQPEKPDSILLQDIFRTSAGIPEHMLAIGVLHRNSDVRLESLRALQARGLPENLAEKLLADPDHRIRLEVMKYLVGLGHEFSEDRAKEILIERRSGGSLLKSSKPVVDEAKLTEFREWQYNSAPDHELEVRSTMLDKTKEFVLSERHFSARGDVLRKDLSDFYKSRFESDILELSAEVNSSEGVIEQVRELEKYLRDKYTLEALNIVCRRGGGGDLSLVRESISSDSVPLSDEVASYLSKFGEWQDIDRIVRTVGRPDVSSKPRSSLLGGLMGFNEDKYVIAARAIYKLGRRRLSDLLAVEMPDQLLMRVILTISDIQFATLKDSEIMRLLRKEQAELRKATALRCVRALTVRRQNELLDLYFREKYRYYNVIHWLDLGVSLSRARARATAQRVIDRTWPSLAAI